MSPDDLKQWLDVIHGGGDIALAVGLYFANKIANNISSIMHDFKDMKEKINYIYDRTEVETLRLGRIHARD